MTWAVFFLCCFVAGAVFSIVSFISGHMHVHFGHHGGAHVHSGHGGHAGKGDVSPMNPSTIAAFLVWFGGAGYLAVVYYQAWFAVALGVATLSGLVGGSVIFWFLAKFLLGHEKELDPADYEMVGVLGSVSGTIRADGTGEILYSRDGTRRAAVARSEEGSRIPLGTEVVVTRYENGIAYVKRWDEMS
jgi:membrane protein implicated in regulation of membrane protease activity